MDIQINKIKKGSSGFVVNKKMDFLSGQKLLVRGGFWFNLSISLLAAVMVLSLALFGYQLILKQKEARLSSQIEELNSQRDMALESQFIALRKSINSLKDNLGQRGYPLAVLKMVEELTLPQVWFSSGQFNFKDRQIILDLNTDSYSNLAKQLFVFQEDERIKQADLKNIGLSDLGGLTSSIDLQLGPIK